jgi:hypothetical protein
MKSRRLIFSSLLLLALGVAASASASSDLWLHVRVDETDGARVKVNVPVSMVEKAIAMLPEEHLRQGQIHLDDCCEEMTAADLRELWQEIKDSPDMTFVTVEENDESVRVWKEAGYLKVHVQEQRRNEEVDVRVPLAVVDALLSGEGDTLNIEAAIRALVEQGEGELVTVSGDDETVRVWVDNIAEAD